MKTSKRNAKQSAKPVRKLLSKEQKHKIFSAAGRKAWQHPTFQKITANAAKSAGIPLRTYIAQRNAARED